MHPPLLYNPRAKANLKRKDMAPAHCMLWGEGDTHLSHALHLSHTHTHTNRYSVCMPDCAPARLDFYVSGFISPLHFGCSVSSVRFSRRWRSVTPMFTGTSSVLFLLCLVSLCFSRRVIFSFLSLDPSLKRKPGEKQQKKKDARVGVRLNHEGNTARGQSRGSLIRSPGTFMLFCLMNAPRHWQVWQILKAAPRPAACMLGLMCQRGGLKSSPCSPTGTRQSPQVNISWHFSWQHAMMSALSKTTGERMIAELPAKTIFSPPDDACQNVCLCVSTTWTF